MNLNNILKMQRDIVYYQLEQEAIKQGYENRAEKMEFERYSKEDILTYMKIYNEEVELNYYNIEEAKKMLNREEVKRTCDECNKEMTKGYCIENGTAYYCSEKCLHKNMTEEEFNELYDNGNGDSYWTEWECE